MLGLLHGRLSPAARSAGDSASAGSTHSARTAEGASLPTIPTLSAGSALPASEPTAALRAQPTAAG